MDDADAPPRWLGILAFGNVADDLLGQNKGDLISVSGRIQRNTWVTPAGEKREQLQIVADSIMSSRTVRPRGGGKRSDGKNPPDHQNRATSDERDLNDPLPF